MKIRRVIAKRGGKPIIRINLKHKGVFVFLRPLKGGGVGSEVFVMLSRTFLIVVFDCSFLRIGGLVWGLFLIKIGWWKRVRGGKQGGLEDWCTGAFLGGGMLSSLWGSSFALVCLRWEGTL